MKVLTSLPEQFPNVYPLEDWLLTRVTLENGLVKAKLSVWACVSIMSCEFVVIGICLYVFAT